MGIYIKSMKMPKSGYVDVRIFHDNRATTATAERPFYKEMVVAEVPTPHGRLIDADAALRDGWTINRTYSASPTEMVYEVKAIDCLPTIIPAEEE